MSNRVPETGAAPGIAELIRQLSDGRGASGPQASAGAESPGDASGAVDVVRFAGLTWVACMASGLRSWSRAAEVLAGELPSLVRAIVEAPAAPISAESRAVLLDEIGSRLRKLTEIPQEESRILQAELQHIIATIWPAAAPADGGPYWRRWDVKP